MTYAAEPRQTPKVAALDAIQKVTLGSTELVTAPLPATMSPMLNALRTGHKLLYSAKERGCLATAIYFEARGESKQGQAAVARVVLNRALSGTYPPTVCGVVYHNEHLRNACQFSFACDGQPDLVTEAKAWAEAENIANEVARSSPSGGALATATHYHAAYVSPHWAPKMKRLAKIGQHIFYNESGRLPWGG
jgi:spore germination cell wall hydrolase CwlJ-like protein